MRIIYIYIYIYIYIHTYIHTHTYMQISYIHGVYAPFVCVYIYPKLAIYMVCMRIVYIYIYLQISYIYIYIYMVCVHIDYLVKGSLYQTWGRTCSPCVSGSEWVSECECVCVSVCVWVSEWVCVWERVWVCECVSLNLSLCIVRLSVWVWVCI
jgi:hypothetical protein